MVNFTGDGCVVVVVAVVVVESLVLSRVPYAYYLKLSRCPLRILLVVGTSADVAPIKRLNTESMYPYSHKEFT